MTCVYLEKFTTAPERFTSKLMWSLYKLKDRYVVKASMLSIFKRIFNYHQEFDF